LLKKGRSLHIGLWNGIGGAIESETSRTAMTRECREETGILVGRDTWITVGALVATDRSWWVDVYATKLEYKELPPLAVTETYNTQADRPVLVPINVLHRMNMAPHAGALIHESLRALRDPNYQVITLEENSI